MNYYTDASSDNTYTAYAIINEAGEFIKGERLLGTAQVGEFEGVLSALKIADNTDVIYTDSQYVANTYNQWMAGWKTNNWSRPRSQPISNLDKVKELYELKQLKPNVKIIWIKRNACQQNKLADKFAYKTLKEVD